MLRHAPLTLLLLAGLLPAAATPAAATSHSFEFGDPAGDVRPAFFDFQPLGGGAAPGVPGNPLADTVDIVRVFVDSETPTRVTLGIQVQDMDPNGMLLAGQFLGSLRYEIEFQASHVPGVTWSLVREDFRFLFFGGLPADVYYLCSSDEEGGFGECSPRQGLAVDLESATLRFTVAREELAADGPDGPRLPRVGDTLEALSANSFAQGLGDRAPDDGPAAGGFSFQGPTANDRLALAFESDLAGGERDEDEFFFGLPEEEAFGVAPGQQGVFPLHVINRFETKKIVNLTARVEPATEGAFAEAWTVTVAPVVVVPARDSVLVNVIVEPTGEARHRDRARIVLEARALGESAETGFADKMLMATLTPSKEERVLHLHAEKGSQYICCTDLDATVNPLLGQAFPFQLLWLNVLDEDPLYADEDVPLMGLTDNRAWRWFEMDTPLGRDLRFDLASGLVRANLTFLARVATPLRVEVQLFAGDEFIGGGRAAAEIGQSPTVVPLEFAPALHYAQVNATSGRIGMQLLVEQDRVDDPVGLSVCGGCDFLVTNVWLRVADSAVTLPLLALPPRQLTFSTGEYLVSVGLKEGKEPEEYVNPGEGLLFNMSVVNEGINPDTVTVRLNKTEAEGWLVTLTPKKVFPLGPGENGNATLVVRAPASAEEGDRMRVEVIAESQGDPGVRSVLRLTVTVTKGIDIPDERLGPAVETKTKSKDSPAAGGLALLAALGAAALLARRLRL